MSTNGKNGHGPLSGIRIIDISIYQNGPFATAMLADLGADVIKIEDPSVGGDPGRTVKTPAYAEQRGIRHYFETCNRGKKSVTLNLKHPKGQEAFQKLVKTADVVVMNIRKDAARRLGADYESLRKINPGIIRAANTGFGPQGPDTGMAVFDSIGQARSGFTYVTADPDGTPAHNGEFGFADQVGAIMLAYSVLAALVARERQGVGQNVEVSQLGSVMELEALGLNRFLIGREHPRRQPRTALRNPLSNSYKCKDGKWVAIMCPQGDRKWKEIAHGIGKTEWLSDPRYATAEARQKNSAELTKLLDGVFAQKPRDEWVKTMRDLDVPTSPVQSFEDLEKDPQVLANDYIITLNHPKAGPISMVGVPIEFSGTPPKVTAVAPTYSQNTEEVLRSLGYDPGDIEAMRGEKVIA